MFEHLPYCYQKLIRAANLNQIEEEKELCFDGFYS